MKYVKRNLYFWVWIAMTTTSSIGAEAYKNLADQIQPFLNRQGSSKLYASYRLTNQSDYLYDFGSSYDQALFAIHAVQSNDFTKAQEILDFYQNEFDRIQKIYVSYNIDSGQPKEWVIRLGEMLWVGMAFCHYESITKDTRYRSVLIRLAENIKTFQQKDGRFLGGVGIAWASTEHNMDAVAFFKMVYQLTGQVSYQELAEKAESWLLNTAYNSLGERFNRGHQDSQFATDTHSWAILVLPTALSERQKEKIFNYVETRAAVNFGFDFTNRHSAISYEWSLQMALAYKRFGNEAKAQAILAPIREILQDQKGIPYASRFIDTTHGWMATPYQSMASLMWYVFAETNFNPLTISDDFVNDVDDYPTVQSLSAVESSGVKGARAYPNPLLIHQGKTTSMTFDQLSVDAKVRIYTYSGEFIKQMFADSNGMVQWNATNDSGNAVASGLYIVALDGANNSRKILKAVIQR